MTNYFVSAFKISLPNDIATAVSNISNHYNGEKISVEDYGTVYKIMQISDTWGTLSVNGGALVGTDRNKVIVSQPTTINNEKISGDGWTLELNKGFYIEKNSADGNYILKK